MQDRCAAGTRGFRRPAAQPWPRPRTIAPATADSPRDASHDMKLIQPGLGESLLAVLEIQPHVGDVGTGAGEIELGPPMSRYAIGHGLRENIGEGARR